MPGARLSGHKAAPAPLCSFCCFCREEKLPIQPFFALRLLAHTLPWVGTAVAAPWVEAALLQPSASEEELNCF